MINIEKLARESGASFDDFPAGVGHGDIVYVAWWRFSLDELQLFAEKVMLAAQQAERERTTAIMLKHLGSSAKPWTECVADAIEEINEP